MLRAYFDDSGTHEGSRVVAMGGFVAREGQWEQYDREWRELLTKHGISYLRMADLESSHGNFEGWGEEKKKPLIRDVIGQVRKWAKYAVSGLVVAQDYEQAVPEWARQSAAFGDAYNFCFQMCVGQSMQYVEHLNPPMPERDQIAFVFEQESKHEGVTRANYTLIKEFRDPKDRMGAFGFGTKQRFLPLQIADFFAYESYKHLENLVGESGRKIRYPLRVLAEYGIDIEAHYFGREKLEALVADYDARGRPHGGQEPWWPWESAGATCR